MTFDPAFDLSRYQRINPFTDGRYHVVTVNQRYLNCERDFACDSREEALAEAARVREDVTKCGVFDPNGRAEATAFVQTDET